MSSKKSSISNKEIKHAIKHEQSVVRDHLKTLSRNSNSHFFLTYGRIIKYGTFSFFRNIWLSAAATLVMTITLVILMITVFASVVLSSTAASMKEKIDITIYLKPTTSEETLAELSGIMEKTVMSARSTLPTPRKKPKKPLKSKVATPMFPISFLVTMSKNFSLAPCQPLCVSRSTSLIILTASRTSLKTIPLLKKILIPRSHPTPPTKTKSTPSPSGLMLLRTVALSSVASSLSSPSLSSLILSAWPSSPVAKKSTWWN